MIRNISDSTFPNNFYLEVIGEGWKHSDEIFNLSPDHKTGALFVIELISERDNNGLLIERFINRKTNEKVAEASGISSSKVSKMLNSYIKEIQDNEKYKSFVTKGFNYTVDKLNIYK